MIATRSFARARVSVVPCIGALFAFVVACGDNEVALQETRFDAGAPRLDASADAGAPDAAPVPCSPLASVASLPTSTSFGLANPFATNVCTAASTRAFYGACLGARASATACVAWRNANAACASCLVTAKNGTRVGPFHSDPTVPASDTNPASLVADWGRALVATCLNGFVPGCGEPALDLQSCQVAACDGRSGCVGVAPAVLDACRTAATGASAACRAPYLTREAACTGVFTAADGGAPRGTACFPLASEDQATPSGIEAYFERVALLFCGP